MDVTSSLRPLPRVGFLYGCRYIFFLISYRKVKMKKLEHNWNTILKNMVGSSIR